MDIRTYDKVYAVVHASHVQREMLRNQHVSIMLLQFKRNNLIRLLQNNLKENRDVTV